MTPLKLPAIISIPSDRNEVIGTYCIDTVFMNTEPPCHLPCDLDWSNLSHTVRADNWQSRFLSVGHKKVFCSTITSVCWIVGECNKSWKW